MRVLVQRCKNGFCSVRGEKIASIDKGLVLLVGFTDGDSKDTIDWMVNKICNLRIFPDSEGVMNLSILDVEEKILSISQFTLYADTKKGNRPSYIKAMNGAKAKLLYDYFNKKLREKVSLATGVFGEDMEIGLVNMGPTTILLER
ncbi:MAG: D-aminoacyl-tRNA deacylase [bacterium]|nr:D-aminoacyl-tRNA deacylase [bacterium]